VGLEAVKPVDQAVGGAAVVLGVVDLEVGEEVLGAVRAPFDDGLTGAGEAQRALVAVAQEPLAAEVPARLVAGTDGEGAARAVEAGGG
jgi:hypothetical protein